MQDQETNWKGRVVVILFITAALSVAGWYGYQYMESKLAGTKQQKAAEKQQPKIVNEQQSSATVSVPIADKNSPREAIIKNIGKILAERHNKDVADITVDVSQFNEQFARGAVDINPMGEPTNATWFAVFFEGSWKLVAYTNSYDNESYYCEHIKQYNFPAEFTDDCLEAIPIMAKEKESFGLTQFSKPATQYEWDVKYDKTLLKLEKRTSVPLDSARPKDGANETFLFTPLKKGQTALTFSLVTIKGELGPLDEQHYVVTIE